MVLADPESFSTILCDRRYRSAPLSDISLEDRAFIAHFTPITLAGRPIDPGSGVISVCCWS